MTQTHSPGAIPRRPAEMNFETIKTRARRIFAAALEAETAYRGVHRKGDRPSYGVLLPFIRMVAAERDCLRAFVLSLPMPARADRLAQSACWQVEHAQNHWSQLFLQVRAPASAGSKAGTFAVLAA